MKAESRPADKSWSLDPGNGREIYSCGREKGPARVTEIGVRKKNKVVCQEARVRCDWSLSLCS